MSQTESIEIDETSARNSYMIIRGYNKSYQFNFNQKKINLESKPTYDIILKKKKWRNSPYAEGLLAYMGKV